MEIVVANRDRVIAELKAWLSFEANASELPGHTYAAYENGKLIAVAGLRLCEGPLCYLDSMATNPEASSETRHLAIEGIVDQILITAKELGFKGIVASSKNPSIIRRALARGFEPIPEIALLRAL